MQVRPSLRAALLEGNPMPFRPDLRVVATYSDEQFATLMRCGTALGGRELELMSDVSRDRFSFFTQEAVTALYDYLAARAALG